MTLEPLSGSGELRHPLSPPAGPLTGARSIFWNEHELRAGWRLLLFLVIAFVIALVETLILAALHVPQLQRGELRAGPFLLTEAPQVFAVLCAAGIMSVLEDRRFAVYGLPRAGAFGARFWQGAAWGIAMISAIMLLIRALHGFSFGGLALHGQLLWGYAILWIFVFICVGLFEEFLFRGYPQYTLATGMGFWPGAVALSAGFAAIHLRNGGEDRIGALSVFVIALFFCLTLRRTGNLWFAVGMHFSFDWGETFLYSVPNSGIVAPGHLLDSSFHGPAWLTGGTVGPEGSFLAFAVVGVAAIAFSFAYPSPARTEQ